MEKTIGSSEPQEQMRTISSPCINVCRMNAHTGLCEGCFRKLDEIAGWSGHDDAARSAILAAVKRRRAVFGGATVSPPTDEGIR